MNIYVIKEQAKVPVTVIHPVGRINLGNASELEKKFKEAYDEGARDFILDLKEVPSTTSAGMRVVSSIYKQLHPVVPGEKSAGVNIGAKPQSPHLKLCNLDEEVRRVMNIAGFDMYLEIYEDVEEALKAF